MTVDWSSLIQGGLLLAAAILAYLQLKNYNEIERFRNTQTLVEEWYGDCFSLFTELALGDPSTYDRRRAEIANAVEVKTPDISAHARRLFAFVANAQYLLRRHLVDEESFLFSLAAPTFAVTYVLAPAIAQFPNARRRFDFSWIQGKAYRYMVDHTFVDEPTLRALQRD